MLQLEQANGRWIGDDGAIYLNFDGSGNLAHKHFFPVTPVQASFVDRLRGWLGL